MKVTPTVHVALGARPETQVLDEIAKSVEFTPVRVTEKMTIVAVPVLVSVVEDAAEVVLTV